MDIIIEFIGEIIVEGIFELSKNEKLPKWLRFILIAFVVLFALAVIGLIIFIGILILEKILILGIAILISALVLLILGTKKFKKIYLTKKETIEKNN